jgi:hypothetical protein
MPDSGPVVWKDYYEIGCKAPISCDIGGIHMERPTKSCNSHRAPAVDLQNAIRQRAEEIYNRSGRVPGRVWSKAESEIQSEFAENPTRHRRAIVVKVNGVEYVGEYLQERSDSYLPGEFSSGNPLTIRFEGDKMFVKRPNGKELETKIVRKIG